MKTTFEAHLVPTRHETAHPFSLRWDGERFREGFGFDAVEFDSREEAQAILDEHGQDAVGLIPTVVEVTEEE
jgi:hypothetical protein